MVSVWREVYIPIVFLLIVLPFSIIRGQFHVILNDIKNPLIQVLFFAILLFSIWGLRNSNLNVRFSTQRSINALMIAYLAHLDMPFAAFIVTWIIVYYFNEKLIIDNGTKGNGKTQGLSSLSVNPEGGISYISTDADFGQP